MEDAGGTARSPPLPKMTTTPTPDAVGATLLARVRAAADLLELIDANRALLDQLPPHEQQRLRRAIAQVYNPDPVARRRRQKAAERERSAAQTKQVGALLEETGIRSLRRKPVFTTPNVFPPEGFEPQDRSDEDQPERRESVEPLHCYVCKQKYSLVHHFYDQMCPACAELNFTKRTELADLRGRVALLTGGRVKIGYQAGLKLLRAGAQLIVTTRFPRDSAKRYAQEPDFSEWGHRLQVFGLDLRHTPSVEAFCTHLLATSPRLDFIINNACQTVRRPPEFYAHMMAGETAALHDAPESARRLLGEYEGLRRGDMLSNGARSEAVAVNGAAEAAGITRAAELSQLRLLAEDRQQQNHLFPEGRLDQDRQQVDLRGRNSWRLLMAEVGRPGAGQERSGIRDDELTGDATGQVTRQEHPKTGQLVVFVSYEGGLAAIFAQLGEDYRWWRQALASEGRLREVLVHERIAEGEVPWRPAGPPELRLRGVTFAYAGAPPVLRRIDLTVAPGSTVAVVGGTGSGKSTLTSLLLRLYDPDVGAITIDGRDLRDLYVDDLRRCIGVVFQQPIFIRDTVLANLTLFHPQARFEEVLAAARTGGIHDTIEALPDGYATVLGEAGRTLSGGQRQRLALARALVAQPAVLLIDEPTAAVDARREQEIAAALRPALEGRTALLVSRRPAILRLADRVVVLADGQITEEGTHRSLAARSQPYQTLTGLSRPANPAGRPEVRSR